MFSDALRLLDEGTIEYMIDDMKQEVDKLRKERDNLQQETDSLRQERYDLEKRLNAELAVKDAEFEKYKRENEELKAKIALLEPGSAR